MKTYKRDNQNVFTSIKTAYNKAVPSEIEVADWQLKVETTSRRHVYAANSHTYYYLVFHHPLTPSFQA